MTNVIALLAAIAMIEGGEPSVKTEHSKYHLTDRAIKQVEQTYHLGITIKDVDKSELAAVKCAKAYLKWLGKVYYDRTGKKATTYDLAAMWNAGAYGYTAFGWGREYAGRVIATYETELKK